MNTGVKDVMKKAKVTVAATALLAGATLAQTAHADEVDSTATLAEEQQNQSVTTAVTQTDVDNAKGELDKANNAVDNQNQAVNNAQQNANNAQDAYDQAQQDTNNAQDLVDKATPEEIENAMNGVTDSQNKVDQAEKDQEQAEQNANNAQGAVNNAQNKVDQAQDQVNDAQNQVNDAQSKVDQAQDILDGTGSKDILDEAEAAKKDEATKKDDLESAKDQLEEAEKADKDRQDAIDKAQSELDKTEQELADKKTDLDQAQSDVNDKTIAQNQAQTNVDDAQKVVDNLLDEVANHNIITIPSGYGDKLKDFYLNGTAENSQALKEAAKVGLTNNAYKSNNVDRVVINDVNHLTEAQRRELTQFAVDLLNQVRSALGAELVVTNSSAMAFADEVANTSKELGHDTTAIPTAAAKFGLYSVQGVNHYENFSSGYFNPEKVLTMNDLKRALYNTILEMLFDDDTSSWGHTISLTGVGGFYGQSASKYIGIDFSILNYVVNGHSLPLGRIHILGVSDKQVQDNTKFDVNANIGNRDIEKELEAAKTSLEKTQEVLSQVQEALKVADTTLSAKKQAYNTVKTNLEAAQKVLSQAQSVAVQTPTAQAHLVQAQDAYNQAQTRLEKANEAVANLNADIKQKKENLDNAKQLLATRQADLQTKQEALTQAQATLTQLQADLVSAQNAVVTAKDNVEDAKEQLVQAQAYLESLQHAPERLAEAKEKEAMAKSNLVKALDQLEAELTTLKALQVKQLSAQTVYETTAKAYQDVLDAQHKQQLQDEYDALVSQGKTPVPIIDETGKIIGYQAETVQSTTTTQTSHQSLTPIANIPVQKASVLPTTGDKGSSVLAVIVGSLLTLFGLVDIRRKQNSK